MKNKKIIFGFVAAVVIAVSLFFLKDVTIERTVELENGVYTGETTLFDSQANGSGTMDYNDGSIYTGEWLDGMRTGYGEYEYFPRASYIGNWQNDLYHGEGVLTDSEGVVYTGNFVEGELESGMVDDFINLKQRGTIEFQREVSDFESTIIGVPVVDDYDDLVEVFSSSISSGNLEFLFLSKSFFNHFEIFSSEDDFYDFADDVDNVMFEKYSFIPNLYDYEYTIIKEDDMYVIKIKLRDDITDIKIDAIHEEVTRLVDELISEDMSDFTKIRTLHDYLCKNITYTMEGSNIRNPYGALIEKKAVCEGYVEAYSLLLNEAGISNYVVPGDDLNLDDNETHIWNLVEFDDGYYHIDVTWDDYDDGSKIGYEYFGINDETIRYDHTVFRDDIPESGSTYNKFFDYYSKTGKSTYIYYNNATYYGQINENGYENGYGVTNWFNGDKYSGDYVNGIRHGQGVIEFNDGGVYEGGFVNDEIKGYGTYTWPDGYSRSQEW